MNAPSSSPAKCFNPQNFFGRRRFGLRFVADCASVAAPVVCVFILCGNLAAQQGTTAENSAHVEGVAQSSGGVGFNARARWLEAAAVAPVGSSSSLAWMESQSDAADAQPGAQKSAPDAPAAQASPVDQPAPQTKRILGIVPNFRAITTDVKLPPQSVKEKFMDSTQDSFDYSSVFIPGILAAYSMGTNATREFHQGAAGYARYFWHAAVDQTSENYMVEFVVPSITHEDTRYYTLGRGGFFKRTGYAMSRAVITRSDSGKEVFNASEVIGAGASAGLSTLYYPSRERSIGNTGKEWGLDVGIDSASFVVREFWPDINHWLFHGAKPSAGAQE